ncbi:MAG TPA: hypothetical protein VMQ73_24080 [Methylomirabilota bacterium]|nr:hypothetical protein [Methylomirabilota bacterium]
MSYDVHIARAPDWSESETAAITLEEWIAYARSDLELRVEVVDGRTESTLPTGEILSKKVKGLVAWLGQHGKTLAWFSHSGGSIDSRNPDTATLRKMHAIAEALSARVQGDEGEFYDASGEVHDVP